MRTLDDNIYKAEIDIKKSKFISVGKKVTSKKEVELFLNQFGDQLATHNCYAYKIGIQNQSASYNDDGEPSGTAGFPILNIIEKHDLTNVCILVIRYYGGIKLGTGPLTRTYSKSARKVIDEANIIDIVLLKEYEISFPITVIKEVDNFLRDNNFSLSSKEFKDKVIYKFTTPNDYKLPFINNDVQIISENKMYF